MSSGHNTFSVIVLQNLIGLIRYAIELCEANHLLNPPVCLVDSVVKSELAAADTNWRTSNGEPIVGRLKKPKKRTERAHFGRET